MFAKMKTSTKVLAGFGVILFILICLGGAGYVMFSRVQSNVSALEEHSLKAVKNSTGVERSAFETILEEKNYVLYKKDEIHQKAKQKLADLAGSLDQVDKIAEQFNNTDLAKKSKEVRALATQYGKLYDDGVAALKSNKAGEETMDVKGNLVGNEAIAYMISKKAEYLEAKDALAIVNRIESKIWEIRWSRQKLKVSKDASFFDRIVKGVESVVQYCDQLDKLHPDASEQRQIADEKKAVAGYLETSRAYWELQKKDEKLKPDRTKYKVISREYDPKTGVTRFVVTYEEKPDGTDHSTDTLVGGTCSDTDS